MGRLAKKTGFSTTLLAAMAIVYIVWGSTYLGIKVALEGFPPFLLGSFRFLAAGIAMYAWTSRGESLRPTRTQWAAAALGGTLMLVGGNGAVTWAEQRIDSGVAALLVASVPLWMALLARVFQGERLRRAAVVGLVLGFVGVGLLVRPSGEGAAVVPSLAVLAGALAWATGSIYVRRAPLPDNGLRATSMQMLAAGVVFGIVGLLGGEAGRMEWSEVTWRAASALIYLAVFGSVIAFSAYTYLLRNADAAVASTYAYVNPFVAVLLGALLLAEPLTGGMLVAGAFILVGVALIVTPGRADNAEVAEESAPATDAPAPDAPDDSRVRLQPCEAVAD